MIRQVLYVSAMSPGVEPADIAGLLQQSRRNNARDGLTGLLLFTGESFLQVLEGPDPALAQALTRISRDKRHSQLLILLDHAVAKPSFAGWTMGYRTIAPELHCDGAAFPLTRHALAARMAADDGTLHTLLKSFCDVELVDA
ncbi:MAG: BLUF domain-containing protein [Alphaproteobacteria bacterium]